MAVETSQEVASPKFHELGFAEFVGLVKPSASVNRLPGVAGDDILIYEVFLNGKVAQSLGSDLECQRFQAELLHGYTEKLGLDTTSFRDTIKVAEILALRHAWLKGVHIGLHLDCVRGVFPEVHPNVLGDWQGVTELTHPAIQSSLKDHKAHLTQLGPALKTASMLLGVQVKDQAPQEVNKGTIVSQNGSFTIMNMGEGNVVAHTNKQLASLPRVGDEVTIAYYRGQGQVFVNREVDISAPYLHDEHKDLAIEVTDKENGRKQVLLFNGISSFVHFASAHSLARAEVEKAIDLMVEKTTLQNVRAPREPILPVGIDRDSGAISLSYKEKGVLYTALFTSEAQLLDRAADFDLDREDPGLLLPKNVVPLERSGPNAMGKAIAESDARVRSMLEEGDQRYNEILTPNRDKAGPFSGPVVMQSELHVVQDVGKGRAIVHLKTDLDKLPEPGHRMSVSYKDGRGRVETRPLSQGQGINR